MHRTSARSVWGSGAMFRTGVERVARDAFDVIGLDLDPGVLLVGFTDDPDLPVVVGSEGLSPTVADLTSVAADARERYEKRDRSQVAVGSRRDHELVDRGYRDSYRAQALRDALGRSEAGSDLTFLVGSSAPVAGTAVDVHPVIAVPSAPWASQPALATERVGAYQVVRSFQDALVRELLTAATDDLGGSAAPEDFSYRWTDRSAIVRSAARQFIQSVAVMSGYPFPSELAVALDEISAQPYEGRTGSGGLLLASSENPHVEPVVEFVEPIRVTQTRSMRKALEMADAEHHLLCDGEKVVGVARLSDGYDPTAEDAFVFNVTSRGDWELRHHDVALLRLTHTRPSLPQPPLDAGRFRAVACQVFPEVDHPEVDVLWDLSQAASRATHGTMLVVHRRASEEAARLAPQAQQVRPQRLDTRALAAVSNIDGAILVDPAGLCHAVGVILDGRASGRGDPSRGARFNSAVRYHDTQRDDCLVIIVSEDGMIDLLPDHRHTG